MKHQITQSLRIRSMPIFLTVVFISQASAMKLPRCLLRLLQISDTSAVQISDTPKVRKPLQPENIEARRIFNIATRSVSHQGPGVVMDTIHLESNPISGDISIVRKDNNTDEWTSEKTQMQHEAAQAKLARNPAKLIMVVEAGLASTDPEIKSYAKKISDIMLTSATKSGAIDTMTAQIAATHARVAAINFRSEAAISNRGTVDIIYIGPTDDVYGNIIIRRAPVSTLSVHTAEAYQQASLARLAQDPLQLEYVISHAAKSDDPEIRAYAVKLREQVASVLFPDADASFGLSGGIKSSPSLSGLSQAELATLDFEKDILPKFPGRDESYRPTNLEDMINAGDRTYGHNTNGENSPLTSTDPHRVNYILRSDRPGSQGIVGLGGLAKIHDGLGHVLFQKFIPDQKVAAYQWLSAKAAQAAKVAAASAKPWHPGDPMPDFAKSYMSASGRTQAQMVDDMNSPESLETLRLDAELGKLTALPFTNWRGYNYRPYKSGSGTSPDVTYENVPGLLTTGIKIEYTDSLMWLSAGKTPLENAYKNPMTAIPTGGTGTYIAYTEQLRGGGKGFRVFLSKAEAEAYISSHTFID